MQAPGLDLDPSYLRNATGGKGNRLEAPSGSQSPFPAQIRFRQLHHSAPLEERAFCHLVSYNDRTNVFRHRLGERETHELLRLLAHPSEAPRDSELPYESNGYIRIPEKPSWHEQRRRAYAAALGRA